MAVSGKLSPPAQKREIVGRLQRVFGARVVGCADLRPAEPANGDVVHAAVEQGCHTSADSQQLWAALGDEMAQLRQATPRLPDAATIRRDHALYSLCRARRGPIIHVLALQRGWQSAPFTEDDRELLGTFHVACRELLDMHSELNRLPRRCHPPFELLLQGMSEKAIASQLQLSIHTVHEYTKVIYNRFGVSSRGELIALWLEGAAPRVV
jgi:hypothetical protein